ncbi:protein NO VEIN domain-containing protein [Comamonas koreensis]|uniref:DUF3883 domain-containing protein n=1 Tax=Comamonas koreensis TaxID=160825 RepID=A0AAW4XZ53_9BURK|nr:DUF3883 domain-containing protein [Comamonas koreensis]MCD2166747.1 DUF3883 domain-containing protein [Comamonas koreensis]
MSKKLALKKLTASDLSFFHTYYTKHPKVAQKGFNLDKKVIETAFFPSLTAVIDSLPDQRSPVALTVIGPGGAAPDLLMRKILKQEKNWRLNGEVIYNPDHQPTRYDALLPDDFALLEFSGAGSPNAVKMVLLAAADAGDLSTHAAFAAAFPGGAMTILSEDQIEQAIRAGNPPVDHPIRDWLDKDLLEDVGRGGGEATEKLIIKRGARGISASELAKAKANAEAVGHLGEKLLNQHFTLSKPINVASHEWTSQINAISPFDFKIMRTDGEIRHIDAKSTAGPYSNPIHLSLSEIHHALSSGVPYSLCRLYNVSESGCAFRIAKNIAPLLKPIVDTIKAMPTGVKVDSLSFDPDYFGFAPQEAHIAGDD